MAAPSPGSPSTTMAVSTPPWDRHEDKIFETVLAAHDLGGPGCWDQIAASELLPGRDAASLKRHFQILLEDIQSIDADLIPLPAYSNLHEVLARPPLPPPSESHRQKKAGRSGSAGGKASSSKALEMERRKGIPWTEEEHKSFLLGLAKFGKGDWRSISRNFVRTRTPTQVASHAQKYFMRLNSMKKDRRRSSIHDITSVNEEMAQSEGPTTGGIQGHPSSSSTPGVIEGPAYAVGQPIVGSTVGTPVMMPLTGFDCPFVARDPMPRPMVPGAPEGVMPVSYPLAEKCRGIGCRQIAAYIS